MFLDIPFYENNEDGSQCLQAAMKMVLKYFLDVEYSLDKLDELTGRSQGKWTYTSQGAAVLYDIGLNVKLFSKVDLEPFLDGESFIRKNYGKDAEIILKYSDIPAMINSINKLLNNDIFEKKILGISEIEEMLTSGYISIVLINHNKIAGNEEVYLGHYVVVTGFDSQNIYYHDSGLPANPTPNKCVPKDLFWKAMNSNGTDNDVIIVYGKR